MTAYLDIPVCRPSRHARIHCARFTLGLPVVTAHLAHESRDHDTLLKHILPSVSVYGISQSAAATLEHTDLYQKHLSLRIQSRVPNEPQHDLAWPCVS